MSEAPGASFWEELRRRKVVRVAVAYAVAGWMVVEVALAIFPEFGIPNWANRMVILLVALGFPVALVLSWAFELTATGLQRTETARRTHGTAQETPPIQKRRNRLALLVGALVPAVIVGALLGAGALWMLLKGPEQSLPSQHAEDATVVAVLPLVNMSPDAENAFFADGVHEEILTQLSMMGDIKVISRTSVMGYANQEHNLRAIAEELHATHIVEGSVRRAGEQVRITAQLIDAATDQHLWAQNFDRRLEDIFQVQSDVAAQIAAALGNELEDGPESSFGTRNIEAYDLYLQARSLSRIPSSTSDDEFARMVELLEAAVARDPMFVQAWTLLAEVASRWDFQSLMAPEAALVAARRAASETARLAPGSVEAFLSQAWVSYYGDHAFAEALEEARRARELAPNLLAPMELEAYLLRRLGRFDESIASMRHILEIDPRNSLLWEQLVGSLADEGRDEEAYRAYLQVVDIEPESEALNVALEFWRLTAYPDFTAMQALADRVMALVRVGQVSRQFGFLINFLLQTGRQADAEQLTAALYADFIPEEIKHLSSLPIMLYHRSRAMEFLGRQEEALAIAGEALTTAGTVDALLESRPSEALRGMNDITIGFMAPFVGEPERASAAIERIRRAYESDPDYLTRRDNNYFLIEVLVASDPDTARELFLQTYGTPSSRFTLSQFIQNIHLWYSFLEDSRVRELFADKPLHEKYLRDIWPHDVRPFPFDA